MRKRPPLVDDWICDARATGLASVIQSREEAKPPDDLFRPHQHHGVAPRPKLPTVVHTRSHSAPLVLRPGSRSGDKPEVLFALTSCYTRRTMWNVAFQMWNNIGARRGEGYAEQ